MKKRISVDELKKYYAMFGDPTDLRFVTHAYKDHMNQYYCYIPIAEDCFKNAVYSFSTTT